MRPEAIDALGRIGNPEAIRALSVAIKNVWPKIRDKAAKALGEIGTEMVVEPLVTLLRDQAMEVRASAK